MTKGDLFSYKLDYETAGQWNGNIGRQSWNHVQGTETVGVRNYTYTYDGLDRLKTATFTGLSGENYSLPNINYDKNGNITQLQRSGKLGGSYGLMDNLSYIYSGNRLTSVSDAVPGDHEVDFVKRGSGAYTYWENGALKSDENEQITNITYNTFLNQPEQVTLSDGRWYKHTYDGSGALIKTEYSTGEYWEFASGMVFKNGAFYQMAIPEGRAMYQNGSWQMEFDYKDHLGNTRVSFKADGNRLVQTAKTDTDPWGVILKTGQENSFQNRFEMQGHEREKTFGLNRINFGARTYNPTIGRFDRPDRFSEKYLPLSTFQYAANNPVNIVDINGDSLDVSALMKSKNHVAAFALFATSKEGKAWLDNYAAAGQEVVYNGKTLYSSDKDGEYHSKGMNLIYNIKRNNSLSSETGKSINAEGGMDINITLSKTGFGTNNVIYNLTDAIVHESFIHGELNAQDFLDNRKLDKSNMGIYKNSGVHAHHYFLSRQFSNNRTNKNSLWPNQAERVLIRANGILSSGLSNNQIKSTMWDFSGSLINVDQKTGKVTKQ